MATLTGFKSVSESATSQQETNGQQNPTFVFDEVSDSDRNEEFVDAQSMITHKQNGTVARDSSSHYASDTVAIEIGVSPESKRRMSNEQQQAAAGNRIQKVNRQQQQRGHQNSMAPNNNTDGDRGSGPQTSVLSVENSPSIGKSPRQPRRSPLMALFGGKPRESVRRLYTDEDQFEIEWANLSLEVQKKWYQKISLSTMLRSEDTSLDKTHKPKKILNSVDGRIKSGEVTAVLGPSGAGKTSLLNSLFGKYRTAVQGSIKVTGAPSKKHLTVCTIPQSDYLIGYLTTEESLWFASRLKNCEQDFDHNRNIERVIELLGLQRCRHTRINKLSGGQYKRVSIAQEMLSSPDILVLDEPTSGLDSSTCYRTVKVLRDLVEASKAHNLINPMSIILTIHQPHREVLDLFHSVYIMAVGGQTLYQGPPSEMEECIDKYSGTNVPAVGYNPASFMVELASEEYGRKPIDSMVQNQRKRFLSSTKHQYNNSNVASADDGSASTTKVASYEKGINKLSDSTITLFALDNNRYVDVDLSSDGGNTHRKQASSASSGSQSHKDIDSRIMTPRSGKNSHGVFWRHVSLMSKRCFLSNARDPLLCSMRIGAHIFIPLVVALIYGPKMGIPNGCPFYKPEINLLEYATVGLAEIEEKHDDIRIQFQNVGLHFMVYYAFGLCMLAFTAISFPLIMHVLIKEIRNGWYSLSTFVVGKMIAELPLAILLPPISVGIIYIMTGQPSSYFEWRYMIQSLILILIIMIAEAKGLIFGAICMNSMQTAVFAASVSTVPFILLSGFLIRIREVPYVLQQLSKFSYFKHAVEALIITRYGFGMCPCDPALIPVDGTPRIIGVPSQIMSLTDYYINAYTGSLDNSIAKAETVGSETNVFGNNRDIDRIVESTTTLSPEVDRAESGSYRSSSGRRAKRATDNGSNDPTTESLTTMTTTESTTATTTTAEPTTTATATTTAAESSTTESTAITSTITATAVEEVKDELKNDEEGASEPEKKPAKQGVFFDKLATLLTRANAFGFSIKSCEDVEPYTMKDMRLRDSQLPPLIGYLFLYIVILKFISYFIVEICVKLKL